jgi:hypothetical protein
MAVVTQQIPTFLGGVSRQQDTKKSPGQLTEIINAFPDPAFGLIKRNGNQFLYELEDFNGITDLFDDGFWFSINRDNDESYLGVITNAGDIRIWNIIPTLVGNNFTYTECTVTGKAAADVIAYLTSSNSAETIEKVTYLDQTYLINKEKTVEMQTKTNYELGIRGTVIIAEVGQGDYTVYLDGNSYSHTAGAGDTAEHILTQIKTLIDAAALGFTVTVYGSSMEITKATAFTLEVKGGDSGVALTSYQDEVTTPSRLAASTADGRRVKILNSIDDRNSYFVKFIGVPGSSTGAGTGFWQEDLGWDEDSTSPTGYKLASPGFNAATMPYKLRNTGLNTFEIAAEDWAPRATGNDFGNPVPSFVDKKIKYGVLNSNRLAFLGSDSIVLSTAKDLSNFFYTSAQTITAADPIDVDVPSFRVGTLHSAISKPQGLILFSQFEQFLLYSENGNLTPFDSVIRTIGQYENAPDVPIRDVGPYVSFISRTPINGKVFGMQPRGGNETPNTSEISQIVTGYIPSDINKLTTDPQNSLMAVYSSLNESIYMYKFYSNGEEQLMQAWFKWQVVGSVQFMEIIQNILVLVTESEGRYNLSIISLVQDPYPLAQRFPAGPPDVTNITVSNARLDFTYVPVQYGTITYDSLTNKSTLPAAYPHIPGRRAVAVRIPEVSISAPQKLSDLPKLFVTNAGSNLLNAGVIYEIDESDWSVQGDITKNDDGTDNPDIESQLVVGYVFDYEVEFPTYYFNQGQSIDWSAILTVARMKFNVGLSGFLEFYLKRYGATEWNLVQPVIQADYYLANSVPLNKDTVFTVPIHQRNTNYQLKLKSTSPFPVTLTSMTWEGNYSTRYIRRA